jgi:hypothetical protein
MSKTGRMTVTVPKHGFVFPFEILGNGGACRDRTDDLKLAKLALSQLS